MRTPHLETGDVHDISHLLRGESGAVRCVAVTEFAFSVRKGRYRCVHYPVGMFARFGAEWGSAGGEGMLGMDETGLRAALSKGLAGLPRHVQHEVALVADQTEHFVKGDPPTAIR